MTEADERVVTGRTAARAVEIHPSALSFRALYYPELVHVVNPHGDVGVITLWSPFRTVKRKLDGFSADLLDVTRSRVAVVANLYGDGMLAMFCNLLFNPQVRHLVALGEDLGLPTCGEIEAFIKRGLEDDLMLGRPVKRVRGTKRVFPVLDGFDVQRLRRTISFSYLGRLSRPGIAEDFSAYLHDLPVAPPAGELDRVRVDITSTPETERSFLPSEVAAHQVVRSSPLECWKELTVRTLRFGRPVRLRKGLRLELRNAKAVITDPSDVPAQALAEYGFDLDRFRRYQRSILDPELPDGISYTYGNRLRAHFERLEGGADSLAAVVCLLHEDPETRGAYIGLWDTSIDLGAGARATPCLTTLFFRRVDGRLTLTATYRSHNLLWAWLENVYGLMAIQRHVAEQVEMDIGEMTVLSHSLGIDPASPRYAVACALADDWETDDDFDPASGKYTLREDPHGYFVVSLDRERRQIIAEHRYGGMLIKRYEADRAVTIERQVAADMAVSLVSHALWLGRELTSKEQLLRGHS